MGVRSKSKLKPIKETEFPLAVRHFEKRRTYRDWVFQHPNASSSSLLMPPMAMGVLPPQSPSVPGAVSTGQGGPLLPASVPSIRPQSHGQRRLGTLRPVSESHRILSPRRTAVRRCVFACGKCSEEECIYPDGKDDCR